MTWLQNSWMDNPTFLAEMAHFAWAYGILLTAALFSATRRQLVGLVAAFFAFAVAKEFWYDLTFELPNDTLAGSALDFAVYLVGLAVALLVIWIRQHCDSKALARNVARMKRLEALALTSMESFPPRIYDPER